MTVREKEDGKKRRQKAYDFLIEKGIKPHLAAGIVGNLMQESYAHLDSTVENEIGALGIAQWLGPRKQSLLDFAEDRGTKATNFDTQLEFLHHELTTTGDSWTSKKDRDSFFNAKTIDEAASIFVNRFERSGEKPGEKGFENRLRNAKKVYLEFNDNEIYTKDAKGQIVNVNPEVATPEQLRFSPVIKDEFYEKNFDIISGKDTPAVNAAPEPVQQAREEVQAAQQSKKEEKAFMEALAAQRKAQDEATKQEAPKQQAPKPINPNDYQVMQNEFMDFFNPNNL